MNKERLLNVAKALRESPNPAEFSMGTYQSCGTPACALGHYAARQDLQDDFELGEKFGIAPRGARSAYDIRGDTLTYCGREVCSHFGITEGQATQLFADGDPDEDEGSGIPVGCGNPINAVAAAEYIEHFVERYG